MDPVEVPETKADLQFFFPLFFDTFDDFVKRRKSDGKTKKRRESRGTRLTRRTPR